MLWFVLLLSVFGADSSDSFDEGLKQSLMQQQFLAVLNSRTGQDILEAYLDREMRRTNGDYEFRRHRVHDGEYRGRHRHYKSSEDMEHRQPDRMKQYQANFNALLWYQLMFGHLPF